METIKNRYDFIFLFDVKDGNPNGDPDFDNMPRTDEETGQGLVSDVCIKRKVRNYVYLLKGLAPQYDIFIRDGNILNSLIDQERVKKELAATEQYVTKVHECISKIGTSISDENKNALEEIINDVLTAVSNKDSNAAESAREKLEKELKSVFENSKVDNDSKAAINQVNEKDIVKSGREGMCYHYYDVRTFGAVMSTGEEKAEADTSDQKEKNSKKLKTKKKIKGLGVVRGPVQLTFARSIDPIFSKSNSITRCCVTKESDENNNNTIGNKYTVSYGLYRMHGFISATDAAKTGFSEEDKELLFKALINAFENDHAAARGEMNPRALIVFKHESHLGNARAGQLFDLIQVKLKEEVKYPRSFEDYDVATPSQEYLDKTYPGVTVEELI